MGVGYIMWDALYWQPSRRKNLPETKDSIVAETRLPTNRLPSIMTQRGGRRNRMQIKACGKCRLLKLHTLKILFLNLLLATPTWQTYKKSTIHSNNSWLLLQTITAPTSTKKALPLADTEPHLHKFQQTESSNYSENSTYYFTSLETNEDASSPNEVGLSSLVKGKPQFDFLQAGPKPSIGRELLGTDDVDTSTPLGSNSVLNELNSTTYLEDFPSRKSLGGNYAEMKAYIFEDAGFSVSFRANANDPDDDRASNKFNSCYLRCGEDNNYPCSCAEKCVVNLNCCEDFADKCPALLDLALSNFDHLLFASVRCDDRLAVFMVDLCPSIFHEDRRPSRENNTYSDNIPSVIASQQNTKAEKTYNVSSIQGVLSNAPFTDCATGIVYANVSIYECNRRTPQNNFTRGKGVTWLTYFETKNNTIPRTVTTLQDQLDLESYSYIPPESHPIISGSMCYNKWTVSCISRLSDRAEMYFEVDNSQDLIFDLPHMYEPFLAAMLVYVENYCHTKSQNSYLLSATQQLKGHSVKTWGPNSWPNNTIGFKYCLAFYDQEDFTPDDNLLECHVSNEFRRKTLPSDLQRKAIISKAKRLKCLRGESNDLTSSGVHDCCPSGVFMYAINVMLL
ncbi:hypothetical protein ElyMa_002329900 [Elysia marginata]|uniref:SMB domain-containing protein n=1 Tax=Elysia marginata TaxID=1093978 RepID=A0AAV4G6V3_9GAST|nr:hypothetical protein ElyMa_002329900 [Elysia marginata]